MITCWWHINDHVQNTIYEYLIHGKDDKATAIVKVEFALFWKEAREWLFDMLCVESHKRILSHTVK